VVQEGLLHFLFENKGSLYDGKGFEMLDALNQHCRPDSVASAFITLLSLFNDNMGELEEIMAFHSHFDEMVNNMAQCKIVFPPILMVMFLFCSLHSHHNDLLEQFWSHYKSLEGASLDSIVADVCYHDEFKFIGLDKKAPAPKGPKAAGAATSPHIDKQEKEWNNPYDLLPSFNIKSVKKGWRKSPRKVWYKRTFGVPDQGQMLDMWESQTTESALRWRTRHIVPRCILELTLEVILEFTLEVILELTLEVILEHVLRIKTMTFLILDYVATAYLYLEINTGEKVMILVVVIVLELSQDWSWSIKHALRSFLL
jgi:hypothetical protein